MWLSKKDPIEAQPVLAPLPAAKASSTVMSSTHQHFQNFGQLPKFTKSLSQGARALVKLSKAQAEHVAVIDQPNQVALLVHCDLDRAQLESIRGELIGAGYQVVIATADLPVIADIYRAAGSSANDASLSDSPLATETHSWLTYAHRNRATDIHLETRGSSGTVRLRIDGEVETMRGEHGGRYTSEFIKDCMGYLFNVDMQTKSGSDSLFDVDKFLYCMVPRLVDGQRIKLRYQSLKGNEGPKAVLRLLYVDEDKPTKTFEKLGYAASHVGLWNQAMETPSGMVLIAGVTGSGKSTSQKSFIELNPSTPHSAVYTVEDPVEYPIKGAHQIPIQRDVSDPIESARRYSEVISALVRADIDVVMLGEIRDKYSSNAAQQFAETGHMALGTVHAHLLPGIVPRLVNPEIGMNREILTAPNMLTLLAYQALVPVLCPACAMPTDEAAAASADVHRIKGHVSRLGLDVGPMRWKRVGGCSECDSRGTVDLTVTAEMLIPDDDWLKPIREGRDADAYEIYRSFSNGRLDDPDMTGKTVFEHTLFKALSGQVDARQCSRFDNWNRFVARSERMRAARAGALK